MKILDRQIKNNLDIYKTISLRKGIRRENQMLSAYKTIHQQIFDGKLTQDNLNTEKYVTKDKISGFQFKKNFEKI